MLRGRFIALKKHNRKKEKSKSIAGLFLMILNKEEQCNLIARRKEAIKN